MKGRRVRLTDAGVGRLKPHTTEYAVWDSEVPGLGVRVRPSGHRSFVWHGRIQGEPVRATVGPAALMTVEDARKRALALRQGNAPRTAEGRSGTPLFRDFVLDDWLPAYRRRCAPSSCRSANRVLERQLIPAFGRLPLDAIRRIDVERWFDAYSRTAPGGANKALDILGQIMNAALAAGHAETAPVKGITKNPRPKLTRFLSAAEIERLHCVLDRLVGERPSRRPQADVVRLLLLTGCRMGEILKLQWSEVDGDRLNLADSKTGPRRVWLSQAAQAILARQPRAAGPYVFPSPRHPDRPLSHTLCLWRRARKEAGLDDVRLHDLRHTVASQAVARGVPLSTVRADARARRPQDDPALRPCRRPRPAGRHRAHRKGHRGCNGGRPIGWSRLSRRTEPRAVWLCAGHDPATRGDLPSCCKARRLDADRRGNTLIRFDSGGQTATPNNSRPQAARSRR